MVRHVRGRVRASFLLAALGVLPAAAPAAAAGGRPYVVVYEQSVGDPDSRTDRLEEVHGFRSRLRYSAALSGFSARLSDSQLRRIRGEHEVAFVSEDRAVRVAGTSALASGETVPTGVRRVGAGDPSAVHEASTVAVAVIDTGIDLDHPDLRAKNGKSCVSGARTADDDNGHGTHVAGIIGAVNAGSAGGESVVGVAPGTQLYAVKVLDSRGWGSWSGVICGIDWVARNAAKLGIRVANLSLAGDGFTDGRCGQDFGDALHAAICNATAKGITHVAAAGNSGEEFSWTVPAVYAEVLTATAMSDSDGAPGAAGPAPTCRAGESDDAFGSFSNFADDADTGPSGFAHVIAAPGVCIRSTWPGGGYLTATGTSMAAPHVAGAVALCHGSGGTAGPCAGRKPADVIVRVRSDAAGHATVGNGFFGDPLRPAGTALMGQRYYGHLAWTGGY